MSGGSIWSAVHACLRPPVALRPVRKVVQPANTSRSHELLLYRRLARGGRSSSWAGLDQAD
eukprot:96508-Heterocapsa_arctica.AAC.1